MASSNERGNPMKTRVIVSYVIALLLTALLPILLPGYVSYVIVVLMYVVMSLGWNVMGGYLGDISFGHAAFFGIGAYTVALLVNSGVSYFAPLNLLLGGAVAMAVGAVVGYPFLRLHGFYLAIGSLALLGIFYSVFKDILASFTRGASGLMVPAIKPYSVLPYYYSILVIALATVLFVEFIVRSRLGMAFAAIRDDPEAARAVGINITPYRVLGFSLSAFIVGLAGAFFAYYNNYVDPSGAFSLVVSFEMLVMVYFGGVGTVAGPVVGSIAVFAAEEAGRIVLQRGYLLVLAIMLLTVFVFMPGGVVGVLTGKTPIVNPFPERRRKEMKHDST